MRAFPPVVLLSAIKNLENDNLDKPVSFPEVETESNFWPISQGGRLEDADLENKSLREHRQTLATPVYRRNRIAHGEKEVILEYEYCIRFENAVTAVMTDLALEID